MRSNINIIGGGVIGLSIARELHRRGAGEITIIEKGICGQESSWAAAGMLGAQADTNDSGEMMRFSVASRSMYVDLAAGLLDETGIDIELDRSGTLFLAFNETDTETLKERVAWQTAAGLQAITISGAEARRTEPFISPDVIGGALFPDDWQVDNRKLCEALHRYAELNSITIRENTLAAELINEHGRIAGVRTANGDEIRATSTVIATGAWTSNIKLGAFPMPVAMKPIRGQIICYRTAKRLFERVIYSSSGYLVPRADGRILSGATSEDVGFSKANTDDGTSRLTANAEIMAPSLTGLGIHDKWSGLRPQSSDGLPVLGVISGLDDLFVATGHYRNGILLAPKTAEIIADAVIDGRRSELLTTFSPDRFRAANAGY